MATGSPQFIKEQVQESVTSAAKISDLLPMLRHLSLAAVKQFVAQQIEQQSGALNKIYFRESSINGIFPDDVLQHILSFDDLLHPRTVNKKWKLLSEKNETMAMRELYRSTIIDQSQENRPISTWIVHPKRRHLNAVEIELGYKGPMNIYDAYKMAKDGDRLLLHGGAYSNSLVINRSVKFIGLGNEIKIKNENVCMFAVVENGHKISFEKIKFCNDSGKRYNFIHIKGHNHIISMTNCKFSGFASMMTCISYRSSDNCLNINECEIEGSINMHTIEKNVSVTNSLFKRCRGHAIRIFADGIGTKLKCIGNTFEDNAKHPIAECIYVGRRPIYRIIDDNADYCVRDNVVKGSKNTNQEFDANVVYRRCQP